MKPLISIVVPVYNVANYLRACIDSILSQTAENWEVVAVNDGSTDGSGDVLDTYAEKDSRITVLHKKNEGVVFARRAGYRLARGSYIWFVDGDDVVHPNSIAYISQAIADNENLDSVVVGHTAGESISFDENCKYSYQTYNRENFHRLPVINMPFCVFNRALIDEGAFMRTNLIVGEDILFVVLHIAKATKIVKLNCSLYGYVQRASSVCHSWSFRKMSDEISFNLEILKLYCENENLFNRRKIKQRKTRFFFGCASEVLRFSGSDRRALRRQLRSAHREFVGLRKKNSKVWLLSVLMALRKSDVIDRLYVRAAALIYNAYAAVRARRLMRRARRCPEGDRCLA